MSFSSKLADFSANISDRFGQQLTAFKQQAVKLPGLENFFQEPTIPPPAKSAQNNQILNRVAMNVAVSKVPGMPLDSIAVGDSGERSFKTVGGEWRRSGADNKVHFYPDGADKSNSELIDAEYYQPQSSAPENAGKWVRLNPSGGARNLPQNKDQARPADVSDFAWKGFEYVDASQVPADLTSDGKNVAFSDPKNAEDQLNALKRYVVENDLAPGMWDEAKFTKIFSATAGTDIRLELEKTGEAAGKTVFKVRIDAEGLTKLRAGLAQYQQEIGQETAGGTESRKEETRLVKDTAGLYYETGRKVIDGTINVVQDSLNAVLFPPFSPRTGAEPNFGRAKVGEMYDELAARPVETNGKGPIPRLETTPLKYEFQSEMMRRGVISGKVDDGVSTGDATTTAASIIAPLVIGKVLSTPVETPAIKNAGALPEVKSAATVEAVGEITADEPVQTVRSKFPNDPLPTDGEVYGIAKVENGKIMLDKQIGTDRPVDFVIDKQGNLILGSKHHLLGNADEVQAAGTLKIVHGKVKAITNNSGHYQPTVEEARKFPDILRKMGLDLKGTKLELSEFKNTPSGYVIGNGKIVVNEYLKY